MWETWYRVHKKIGIILIRIWIWIWIGINMEIRIRIGINTMPIYNTAVNYFILLQDRVIILCFFLSCLDRYRRQEQVPLMAVFLTNCCYCCYQFLIKN
jgi:hypothetical protein